MQQVVLELHRSQYAEDPFAFRIGRQQYTRRTDGGGAETAVLDWDEGLLRDLSAVSRTHCEPAVVQRLGDRMRTFLEDAGWSQHAVEIIRTVEKGESLCITLRLSAAELFALPWELLTLKASGQPLGALPGVTLRYAWPETRTADEQPSPRPEGGRILLAWSAAGGQVPAAEHVGAIARACTDSHHPFHAAHDVLPQVSLPQLVQRLEEATAGGAPITVLHILCHGATQGSTYGLFWDGPEERMVVDGGRLSQLLAPHAKQLRLVVLCACDSANSGQLGNHLGSVAQALHRAGIQSVVASRFPLSVAGSIRLTEVLYGTLLAEPASLESAIEQARKKLALLPGLDWAGVQLYCRPEDGQELRPVVFRPFRGLLAFQPEHRRFFFGRDAEIGEVLGDLQALIDKKKERFLVVAGGSGSGKSSLVFAGAVPKLLEADPQLTLLRMRPGSDPTSALQQVLAQRTPGKPALLVVDQFEEVFTQTTDHGVRESFVRLLWALAAAPEPGLRILITLRVDFIGRCGELVISDGGLRMDRVAYDEEHRVFIAQLHPDQLRAAIVEPLRKVGLGLQAGLLDRMLQEVGLAPGGLPMLEDLLDELWERREGTTLTQDAYHQLGGVIGALQRRADAIIDKLTSEEQDIARRLLVNLVAIADDTTLDTRLRVALPELEQGFTPAERPGFERVLKALVGGRLLVQDEERHTVRVEVAHEALLRKWSRLRGWLDQSRVERLTRRQREESERREQLARLQLEKQQQRSRMLRIGIAISSSLALLAGGLGGLSIREAHLANQQTRLAINRLDQAVDVAQQVVLIGDKRLFNVAGAAEARRDLLTLSAQLLATLNPGDHSVAQRTQVARLRGQADLILANPRRGEKPLEEATRLFEQALTIAQEQLQKNPNDSDWQRDLAISYGRLGNVTEKAGRFDLARQRYEQKLSLLEKLATTDAGSVRRQRDLAFAYDDLGSMFALAGQLDPARKRYEQGLAVHEKLAAANPNDIWLQWDLSSSLDSLGDVMQQAGQLDSARKYIEQGLALREKFAATDPSNTWILHDLAISYGRLGDVFHTAGQFDSARKRYEQGLAFLEKLTTIDPSSTVWQRDLEVNYGRLGDVLKAAAQLEPARKRYEQALLLSEQLASTDPTNTQWLSDLGIAYYRLGVLLQATGELEPARKRHEQALALGEKLSAIDPSNIQWQRELAYSYDRLGETLQKTGQFELARKRYEQALARFEQFAVTDPSDIRGQIDLADSYNSVGDMLQATGQLELARKRYEQGLPVREKFAATDPSNPRWQRNLALSYNKLGIVLQATGQLDSARKRYEQGLAVSEKLAATDPNNTQWQLDLLAIHLTILSSLQSPIHRELLRHHYAAARTIFDRLEGEKSVLSSPELQTARRRLAAAARLAR